MRVLYLAHRVPFAPNRGDRIRAYHTLRVLRERSIDTHVVALAHDRDEIAAAPALARICSSYEVVPVPRFRNAARGPLALAGSRPLTHVLLDSPGMAGAIVRSAAAFRPDAVLTLCSGMARFALQEPLAGVPFVLDMVDVDSAKWQELAAAARPPLRWVYAREARTLARFERQASLAARAAVVISEAEAESLRQVAPGACILVAGNGVDIGYYRRPAQHARGRQVVFTAVFDYAPNEAGAAWTIEHVWPRVLAKHPEAELLLVGARPTGRLRAAAARARSVRVTGSVPDVRPYLWGATVAIAPLAIARGTQNKVLEAVAAGLPAVVTPRVLRGLPEAVRPACTVADTPDAFAAAVIDALEARGAGTGALGESLRWDRTLAPLVEAIERSHRGSGPPGRPHGSPRRPARDEHTATGVVARD